MNTIIIYSSKYGCTADCANYLKRGLPGSVTLADINNHDHLVNDLENYDTVIFGSSVYVGAISKKMRMFCRNHVDLLNTKKIGIFLCCGIPAEVNGYFAKNFPSVLLENAVVTKYFGGEARIDQLKGLDKIVMRVVARGNYDRFKILPDNIESFIKKIS